VSAFRQMRSPWCKHDERRRLNPCYDIRASDIDILSRWVDLLHSGPCAGNRSSLLSLSEAIIQHKVASEVDKVPTTQAAVP
jgi:hypothetical protein